MTALDFPYFVYTAVDADGVILYIGFTGNPRQRVKQHAADKEWWDEVANVSVDAYPSELEALAAEKLAIKRGRPKYNLTFNRPLRPKKRKPQADRYYPGLVWMLSAEKEGVDLLDWLSARVGPIGSARREQGMRDLMEESNALIEAAKSRRQTLEAMLGIEDAA